MERTKTSFIKGAAILGIAGLIVKIIGAVYRIPLTNILQQNGYDGMLFYETAYPYYSWLLVISSAGFPTAISKLVAERVAVNDRRGAKDVFKTAMRLLIIIGLITMLLLFFGAPLIAKLGNVEGASYSLRALAPALFIVSIMCAYRGYLQGLQMMTGTAISQITEQVGKLIMGYSLAILFVRLYPTRPELWAMGTLIGISISELLALIVIYLFYRKKRSYISIDSVEKRTRPKSSFRELSWRLLAIAVPITIGASIMPITAIADSIFIKRILTESYSNLWCIPTNVLETGNALASSALKSISNVIAMLPEKMAGDSFVALRSYVTPLINMPAVLTLALSMSLVPAISERMAENDAKAVRKAGATGMKLAMIIGAPCAAGLFVVGAPIIAMLFTKVGASTDNYSISGFISEIMAMQSGGDVVSSYTLAGGIMQIAAIGVLFLSLVQTMTGVVQGMGRQRIPVYFLIVGGALKVALMIILMKYTSLGILGAALSTVVCYAVAGIGDTIYAAVKAGIRVRWFDTFGKPIFSAGIMGVAVYFAYEYIYSLGHPTLATIGSICIGVVVYAALMWLLKAFNKNDMEFMPGGKRLAKLFRIKTDSVK